MLASWLWLTRKLRPPSRIATCFFLVSLKCLQRLPSPLSWAKRAAHACWVQYRDAANGCQAKRRNESLWNCRLRVSVRVCRAARRIAARARRRSVPASRRGTQRLEPPRSQDSALRPGRAIHRRANRPERSEGRSLGAGQELFQGIRGQVVEQRSAALVKRIYQQSSATHLSALIQYIHGGRSLGGAMIGIGYGDRVSAGWQVAKCRAPGRWPIDPRWRTATIPVWRSEFPRAGPRGKGPDRPSARRVPH